MNEVYSIGSAPLGFLIGDMIGITTDNVFQRLKMSTEENVFYDLGMVVLQITTNVMAITAVMRNLEMANNPGFVYSFSFGLMLSQSHLRSEMKHINKSFREMVPITETKKINEQ